MPTFAAIIAMIQGFLTAIPIIGKYFPAPTNAAKDAAASDANAAEGKNIDNGGRP